MLEQFKNATQANGTATLINDQDFSWSIQRINKNDQLLVKGFILKVGINEYNRT